MLTVLEVVKRTTEFFEQRGIEGARLNAELLIGHALGLKRMQVYLQFERPLSEPELTRLRPLVKRRGEREPLQYILGEAEFHGLKLKVDRCALIPRPETELLVDMLVGKLKPAPVRVLDLGTGCGAIALALAKAWPEAEVTAVDNSPPALALAAENVASTGLDGRVRLVLSDWFTSLDPSARFDLIVSNPPYLSESEMRETQAEVRQYEPPTALTPGATGLEALEIILRESRSRLAPGGLLACETGIAQHGVLTELMQSAGYARCESLPDLTKRDRYFLAWN